MVRERGITVILITHKLPEVMRVSDRVGVMRRGKLVSLCQTRETTERELASLMVGREVFLDDLRPNHSFGQEVLQVQGLSALGDRGVQALRHVDLAVRAGEILGVCGVEGNGQTELAECIMGMRPKLVGKVLLKGRDISHLNPGAVRAGGVRFIPEDRLRTGLSAKSSVADNLLLGRQRSREFSLLGVHLRRRRIQRFAETLSEEFDIRSSGIEEQVSSLSGGNMQKTVLAREFSFDSTALVVCQPTRGVDIGATEFIHRQIIGKRESGCAVLLMSADLDELFRLSDRLVTLFEGSVTGCFRAGEISKEEIGYYMTGGRMEGKAE